LDPPNIKGALDSCTHPFCFECILQWSKTSNTCPFCKQRFTQITKIDPNAKRSKKIKVEHADQHPDYDGPESYIDWSDDSDDGFFPLNSFGLMVGLFGFPVIMDDDDSEDDELLWDEDDFEGSDDYGLSSDDDMFSEDISFPENLNTPNPRTSPPGITDLTSPSIIPESVREHLFRVNRSTVQPSISAPPTEVPRAGSRRRRTRRSEQPTRPPSSRIASRASQTTQSSSRRQRVTSVPTPPPINQQRTRSTHASSTARNTTVQSSRRETAQNNPENHTTQNLGRHYRLSSR